MIIEIADLDDDELGLVDAIEGMDTQYGGSHPQQCPTGFYGTAWRILNIYGLRRQNEDDGWDDVNVKHALLCGRMEDWKGKCKRHAKSEYQRLNDRSKYLLWLLVNLADESLMYPEEGYLYHESMSAGEWTMWQMSAYKMIYINKNGYGYWTKRGKEVLQKSTELAGFSN